MVLDKRKGSAKAQVQTSLKQRTLFDSFIQRAPSKTVTAQPVPLDESSNSPDIAVHSQALGERHPPPSQGDGNCNSSKDLELVECSDTTLPNGVSTVESDYRRSPSIIILENTPETQCAMSAPSAPTTRIDIAPMAGKTKDEPIIIPSSPIKVPASFTKPGRHIHPFFAPKRRAPDTSHPPAYSPDIGRETPAAPYNTLPPFPDQTQQHVRGPQTTFERPSSFFPTRPLRPPREPIAGGYHFLRSAATPQTLPPCGIKISPIGHNTSSSDIPEEIKTSHPAVAHLVDLQPGDIPLSRRPWAEKWRPSCAQEVLGNERNATYLRDWLHALELQLEDVNVLPASSASQDDTKSKGKGKCITRGVKRPRVVRAVDKKRRKKLRLDSDEEEDDWIVYSDEEDEDDGQYSLDQSDEPLLDDQPPSSASSSIHELSQQSTVETKEQPFLGQLHNTILLVGPSGCGKTACVYACAEELGWDVFEVYPGIGRRSSTNVDNLIGEVGKNHLVVQSHTSDDASKSFPPSKDKRQAASKAEIPITLSPRKKGGAELTEHETPYCGTGDSRTVRQSLILLEEVDILFKEDTNFWPTIVKIIEECKRPIICTCNDISLVPLQDLPLQCILYFTPCPIDPAACYLQALCAAEGYSVDWREFLRLHSDALSQNQQTSNSRCARLTDLRASINDLQIISSTATSEDRAVPSGAHRMSIRGSEFLSFLDGHLEQDLPSRYLALAELGNYTPSDDDETGHVILFDLHANDVVPFEVYDRHNEITLTAIQYAKVDMDQYGGEMQHSKERKERIQQSQMIPAGVLCRGVDLIWNSGVIGMEYIPYVRQMVEAEDLLEMKEQKQPRVGRMTWNSRRSNYERVLDLKVDARQGLAESVFL